MNYGVDLDRERAEQDGTEWRVGATSQICSLAIPLSERLQYLPHGEVQFGVEDFQDCVTRAYINILEAKFTRAYRINLIPAELKSWLDYWGYVTWRDGLPYVEFSDRFIAVKSNTTRTGNSFKAPAQAIHEYGLIPKQMLPRLATMTWAQYHDPSRITQTMLDLGAQWKLRFPINYEQGWDIENANKLDSLNVGVFAWPKPVNGVYPRNDGPIVHAVHLVQPKYKAFDNYIDTVDGDYLKSLAPDYRFYEYAYRIYVSGIHIPDDSQSELKVAIPFLAWIVSWWRAYRTPATPVISQETPPISVVNPKPVQSGGSRLYDLAYASIGHDLSKKAPDERGCAEALSRLINQVDPAFPILLSTIDVLAALKDRYQEVTIPKAGDIAIFATEGKRIGHCGVYGKTHIMSNDSRTGTWEPNYTHETWVLAAKRRFLKNHFFRMP